MSKQRKFNERQDAERQEGYKTVETGLPSDRFSETKQVASADDLSVTPASIPTNVTGDKAAKVQAASMLKSKMKVRPDVSVEDLGSKQVGGVPLAVETNLRNVAGARSQSPADDMSRTPYTAGNYRPDTRYGKKRGEDLFELDNAAIEQVVPVVEDLQDLRSAPDATVGYNGRQQFKQTRQKKNFTFGTVEKLPQQLLNDASLDFCDQNIVVYATGQVVTPNATRDEDRRIDAQADYPTVIGGGDGQVLDAADVMHKSNYRPISLNITTANGHIDTISITEDKYNAVASPLVRDEANLNWQVDANNIAKTMIKIQKEMGRETTDKWTPLAYVINQPYQYNMLMHDIEASTGAIMAAGYRSAVSSLAYQRNIVKKDGINPQRNAIKMILEGFAGTMANNNRDNITDLDFAHSIFNRSAYQQGAATAMIAMFDTVGKYRTKADILGLQRSFGLHLQKADNNLAPLRCKPEFLRALDKAHMFSTVDGNYNPYLPIFETKKIDLILPMSLNKWLVNWKNPVNFNNDDLNDPYRNKETGTVAPYMYSYDDIRNPYDQYVYHPIIEGLIKWLLRHEGAFLATYGDNATINIPWTYDMQSPAMIDMMLCSASQYVLESRNIIFRDILFAGEQETYIWDDLKSLKDLDPLYSSQLKIGKYDEPLTLGKMSPDSAIRTFFGDHKQLSDVDTGVAKCLVQYYEPWYLNENAFTTAAGGTYTLNSGFFNPDTPFNMSFPSIRDGVRHEYVDLIKGMEPKDVMLSLDRKLDILKFCSATVAQDSNGNNLWTEYMPYTDATTNGNKIKVSTVRYDGNSDGRIITKYDMNEGHNYDLLAKGMYCIPKEIGYIDDDYSGISVITEVGYDGSEHGLGFYFEHIDSDFNTYDTHGVNKYYYDGSKAMWLTSYRVESDSPDNGSIDRSAALTNTFYRFFATSEEDIADDVNDVFVTETGLVPTRAYNDSAPDVVVGIYNLGSVNASTTAIDTNINTGSRYMWTILQRWFTPVNPFANAYNVADDTHSYDPFETSYFFGVCGFLAADYTQHVLERLSEYDQLGFDYTEDTNIKSSPIFR